MRHDMIGKVEKTLAENPDRISGLIIILLALGALYVSQALPFGSIRSPDAGFFPRSLATLLFIFGIGIYAMSFAGKIDIPMLDERIFRVLIAAAAFSVYALTLSSVGFVVATILVLLLVMRGFSDASWRMALSIAIPSVLVSYLAFTKLGVPLPRGILPL